jgi:hypothetical protein
LSSIDVDAGAQPACSPAAMRSASEPVAFPARSLPWGPLTLRRLGRTFALYAGVLLMGWSLIQSTSRCELQALALGLMVPGGGFLAWADPGNPHALWAVGLSAASVVIFVAALAIWFATGNVLLPVAVWFGAALAAAAAKPLLVNQSDLGAWPAAIDGIPHGLVLLLMSARSCGQSGDSRRPRFVIQDCRFEGGSLGHSCSIGIAG